MEDCNIQGDNKDFSPFDFLTGDSKLQKWLLMKEGRKVTQ